MGDISARALYSRSVNSRAIKDTVSEIYKSISHEISAAHNNGLPELLYKLPDVLDVANLEPADAQLVIYSQLIERIEAKELIVSLRRLPDGVSALRIRWPSILDKTERARMNKIIIDHIEK